MKKILVIVSIIGLFFISSKIYACVCDYQYNYQYENQNQSNNIIEENDENNLENTYHYNCGVPDCPYKEYHIHETNHNYHHAGYGNNHGQHRSCHHKR